MIEKQIVEILLPLADRIIELEKKLATVEASRALPEPEAIDIASIAREAASLVTVPVVVDGKDGAPGADGPPGPPGEKGDTPEVSEVVAYMKSDVSLMQAIRGVSIKSITMTGADVLEIELDSGEQFEVNLPVGPQGEQGEKGDPGKDGEIGPGIDVPKYEKGAVYREGARVMAHLGKIYEALKDTYAQPPSSDWARVGTFGNEWRGLHKDGNVYEDGDLYIDGGSTFMWLNGKGHMFAQRGRPGSQGEKGDPGMRGPRGEDGVSPVHGRWTPKSIELFMSDGSTLELEVEDYEKNIVSFARAASVNFLEEQLSEVRAEGGVSLRSFKGQFESSRKYREGDVVTFNKTMWVARGSNSGSFDDTQWLRMVTVIGGGGATRLQDMTDIGKHSSPALGNVPIWTYPEGHKEAGQFQWGSPNAHLKNWESTIHWESGTSVFYNGQIWRATSDSTNIEPQHEDGRATIFMNAPGEPSFGIVPSGISSTPPAAGTDVAGPKFRFAYWVQYVSASDISIWKFKIHRIDHATGQTHGEWVKQTWPCGQVRGLVAPHTPPSGTAVLWLYGRQDSTKPPLVGQQSWSSIDLSTAIGSALDVAAPSPADGDILVYNAATHKWTATAGRTWFTSMQTAP